MINITKPGRTNIINVLRQEDVTEAVNIALRYLKELTPFIVPTDTVYGLVASVNKMAMKRLLSLKGYSEPRPLACLVSSLDSLKNIIVMTDLIRELIHRFPPGSITIVAKLNPRVTEPWKNNFAPYSSLGFRIPNSSFLQAILEAHGSPIVGSSANLMGQEMPNSIPEMAAIFPDTPIFHLQITKQHKPMHVPSTVIDVTVDPPRILRTGAVSEEQL